MMEKALRFGENDALVGILTDPPHGTDVRGVGVIVLNAGILHRVGPSRMNVHLTRRAAELGFTAFRFDFSGIGDSEPRSDGLTFDESCVSEVREAMDLLERRKELERFVLVGLCSGADAAYHAAVADERVVGLVPLDGHAFRTWRYHLHRYGPRLLRWESWKNVLTGRTYVGPWIRKLLGRKARSGRGEAEGRGSAVFQRPAPEKETMEGWLRTFVGRGTPMLAIFTGDVEGRYTYRGQLGDAFSGVTGLEDLLTEHFMAHSDHTFTRLRAKDEMVSRVVGWLDSLWGRAPGDDEEGVATTSSELGSAPSTDPTPSAREREKVS